MIVLHIITLVYVCSKLKLKTERAALWPSFLGCGAD